MGVLLPSMSLVCIAESMSTNAFSTKAEYGKAMDMGKNYNYSIPLRDHIYVIPPPKTEEEYQRLLEEIASLGEVYDTVKEV